MVEADAIGVKTAAVRKLEHELGIVDISVDDLTFVTRIRYTADSDGKWAESEIDYILVAVKDNVKLGIVPNEVAAVRYISRDDLDTMFAESEKNGDKMTPWFTMIYRHFLREKWDSIVSKSIQTDILSIHALSM